MFIIQAIGEIFAIGTMISVGFAVLAVIIEAVQKVLDILE